MPGISHELGRLKRQNAELRSSNASKDEFIALASHQLRTPATGVKQYLGMLLEGYMGMLTKGQREFIQKAYDNNERQIGTINDLLHVAQIDADKIVLHCEECDVAVMIQAIVNDFRTVIRARKQHIVLRGAHSPAYTWADPLRLRMVFDNIIDNASKYSEENTTITITIHSNLTHIKVRVSDHGVGIAEQDFPKLFQKFSRLDNPRSIIVGGNGLGLYLARRIVSAHAGDVMVSSKVGEGTSFSVRLARITPKV